jgi:predicted esterase
MKRFLHTLLLGGILLAGTVQLFAQDCGTAGRYNTAIFPQVTKTTDIVFGRNSVRNYSTGTDRPAQDLLFDFYQPTGDPAVKRPLVILAFGGGFISGSRADLEPIAMAFAMRGYTVAAIDYRLVTDLNDQIALAFGDNATKQAIVNDVIVKASADVRAAIRFFKHDAATANTYRIDTDNIFVGGASAGAISAMQAVYTESVTENPTLALAYAANGGLEGNTDLPAPNSLIGTYNSTGIAGVINIAGAVLDPNLIDANEPPIFSAQGENDEVIPYNSGTLSIPVSGLPFPVTIPITFYGSNAIATRATAIGLRNVLLTIPGGNHESPGQPANVVNVINDASTFMRTEICGASAPLPVTLKSFTVRGQNCAAVLHWETAMEKESSHYEVEASADGASFSKVAAVQSRNAANGAAYTFQIANATKAGWYRLKIRDRDGSFTYSAIQRFTPQCGNLSVQVFPNPAQNKATVSGLEAGMLVQVLTADGKQVWAQRAAGKVLDIPVESFRKGLLLVQVRDAAGNAISSTKLVKN